ncbi:MAG: hypothetical protein B7Y39_09790 [Bdellovibrio sp. 28-41-41]|nr:MAG: hypothetical protein B7Y39_09790 [Bdellovibrio sp. 28-41-41]
MSAADFLARYRNLQSRAFMGYIIRKLHKEFPFQISGRCNNKENFPVPLSEAWEIFSDYLFMLHRNYEMKIHSFVLMSNHYHLLISDPELKMSKGMATFMRDTSKEMGRLSNRINKIWGSRFHSCLIDDPKYLLNAYKYNYRNPVAAGVCQRVEDYPWSTLQILLGKKSGVIPLVEDETLMSDPEGTLDWLNEAYLPNEVEVIKAATKKKIFKLSRDPKSGRKQLLTSFNS